MLLSMFISFLLGRKFIGRVYVGLLTFLVIVVSFFSLAPPLPLSFPFHVSYLVDIGPIGSIFLDWTNLDLGSVTFTLYFLTFEINAVTESNFYGGAFFLYYSFFFLVNIVGAIIGYWIGKSAILERLFRKKTILSNKQSKQMEFI